MFEQYEELSLDIYVDGNEDSLIFGNNNIQVNEKDPIKE